jgi:uncharacterized membrane protein YgcG
MKKILSIIFSFFFLAGTALAVTIDTTFPGVSTGASPGEIIGGFYKWSLGAAGVLALGAVVWGGIKYTMSAGNPSGQGEGKEWVKAALLGLLLLLGAYLILYTINPNLVNLGLPTLQLQPASGQPAGSTGGFTGFGGGSSGGGGASGSWGACTTNSDCGTGGSCVNGTCQ